MISWDEYFIGIAKLSSKRSKDPNTRVGACIVKSKKIVGTGYNGLSKGFDDEKFDWNDRERKYPYVVHAEQNAIINSFGNIEDSKIYVTLFPCSTCAKLIVQSGINEVVYSSDKYHNTDDNFHSKKILEKAGVKYRRVKQKR